MDNKDAFCGCHPLVNLAFFAVVIGFSMFLTHPVALGVSLCGALCFFIKLRGVRSAGFILKLALPVALITSVINVLFNHRGETVLARFPNGSPITLESLLYGLSAAVMMASVLIWFGCFSDVMTSEKIMYLFGGTLPTLSLILSMTLRFIPRFREEFERVREARLCMGKPVPSAPREKLREAYECFSAMTTRSLEGSADTADSMKSRGFGLRGRTSFAIYRITPRDIGLLVWLGACAAFLIVGVANGCFAWELFPTVGGELLSSPLSAAVFAVYLAAALTPLWVDILEVRQWRSSR